MLNEWKVEMKLSLPITLLLTPGKVECKLNKNNDDNSDVAKSYNKNMNEVPYCWKIVRKETKGRNQDCTDPENCKSIEQERCGKLESDGRLNKNEDTKCDDEHVNYSDISDTSTSTSIIQDGNMVHNSAPDDVSSDSGPENVIIRKKKWNPKTVMKMRSEFVLKSVDVCE